MSDLICMGEYLIEFIARQRDTGLPDVADFVRGPGGAPANVAAAFSKLGGSAGFLGKVGDDPFGDYLTRELERIGVDTTYLVRDEHVRTTAVFVAVWEDGRKDLCFYRNPGADLMLTPGEVDLTVLRDADAFHFGSIGFIAPPLADAQTLALRTAQEEGLLISYDPNYRPTLWEDPNRAVRVIREHFASCHLAKVSEEEWKIVAGDVGFDEGAEKILSAGTQLLLISRGEYGALAYTESGRAEVSGISVEVVETTGAGDSFLAATLLRLLPIWQEHRNLSQISSDELQGILEFANAAGALTCLGAGAIPSIPSLRQVNEFLESGISG